ncbi:MAG TPA: L,D-transpeptidase, partial [Hyphomicrobiaceae bacterium]|nr:L,D-transpeptidase [Hyphomicrobiaceae bacterium]
GHHQEQADGVEHRRCTLAKPRHLDNRTLEPCGMDGGGKPDIKPAAPPIVSFSGKEAVGSIIVDTGARKLFFVLPGNQAYEYPISVGRDGFTWSGTERISRIASWPSWTPPAEMHKRVPGLPITVSGGLINPQGARALYLGNTIYRIHGTNNERTIGRANSSGCFRMSNEHVVHLATIAKVGTTVKVVQTYAAGASAPLPSLFSFFGPADDDQPKPTAKAKPKRPLPKKAVTTAKAAATVPATTSASAPAADAPTAAPASVPAPPAASAAAPATSDAAPAAAPAQPATKGE